MLERYKSASAVLLLALALGLLHPALVSAQAQARPAETPTNTPAQAAESRFSLEETAPEVHETAPSNAMKTFDALAVRPVTFVSSVFSAGAFIFALPFAALDPAMDVEKTRKNLVEEPFQDTFQRPLGDFNGSAW